MEPLPKSCYLRLAPLTISSLALDATWTAASAEALPRVTGILENCICADRAHERCFTFLNTAQFFASKSINLI